MLKHYLFFALFLLVLPPSSQVEARLGEDEDEQQMDRNLQVFYTPCPMGCPDPIKYPDYAPCKLIILPLFPVSDVSCTCY
jgi:hypothetical protein